MSAQPAPASRRREESERRRRSILEAAREIFGTEGHAGATVAKIAARAGVSHGLLYQFFESKDQLFDVVLQEVIRDWVRAMVPDDPEEGALDALEGMLRRSVEFCRSHPLLPAVMSRDPSLRLQRLSPATADRVEPHRKLVASILRRGIDAGELRADLDVPAVADVVCQLQGHYSGRAYMRDPAFPMDDAILDAVVHFIRNAVTSRP